MIQKKDITLFLSKWNLNIGKIAHFEQKSMVIIWVRGESLKYTLM